MVDISNLFSKYFSKYKVMKKNYQMLITIKLYDTTYNLNNA